MSNTRRILEALAEEFGGTDVRQIVMAHTSEGWSRRSRAELQPGEITFAHHYAASGLD
jgi:hypothetical protein